MASPASSRGEVTQGWSGIACFLCRKRKIRCSKDLPRCRLCKHSDLRCEYPERARKPGPKIGSSQKIRRARRATSIQEDNSVATESNARLARSSVRSSLAHPNIATEPNRCLLSMQTISFIIHPSQDSCVVENEPNSTPTGDSNCNDEPLLTATSYSLGINPDLMKQL
jgi:hypothetical protein